MISFLVILVDLALLAGVVALWKYDAVVVEYVENARSQISVKVILAALAVVLVFAFGVDAGSKWYWSVAAIATAMTPYIYYLIWPNERWAWIRQTFLVFSAVSSVIGILGAFRA